jgi:hypothetical protein
MAVIISTGTAELVTVILTVFVGLTTGWLLRRPWAILNRSRKSDGGNEKDDDCLELHFD